MQHAAMNGFQPVPDVGQSTAYYHTHRVVEIRLLHLVFETYRQYLLRNFSHKNSQSRSDPVSKRDFDKRKNRVHSGKFLVSPGVAQPICIAKSAAE
jgi:hypothetical protein